MTATDHNKIISILFFIKGGLTAFIALILMIVYGLTGVMVGGTMISAGKGDEKLIGAAFGGFFVVFAIVLGLFILAIAAVHLMAGWKMHKRQSSAKTWATIGSILAMLNIPLGTALAVYALWFFYGDEGKRVYGGQVNNFQPPQPPHNWQQ